MPSCGIAILVRLRSPPAPMDGTPVWQATRPETYQEEVSDLQLFAFCEWLNALPLLWRFHIGVVCTGRNVTAATHGVVA
jgi:hypothetical protein